MRSDAQNAEYQACPEAGDGRATLPPQFAIDYEALRAEAPREGDVAPYLRQRLPLRWRETYAATAVHPTNLIRFRHRTFEYICDQYSQLEATGQVPYDQTIEDRVVAVLGTSACPAAKRDTSRMYEWSDRSEQLVTTERDQGHFMAHCIGGGLEVNVFSQERRLNRGWSAQGKIYRQMENYCYQRPGTFCFARPIYADGSNVPRWLEFGLLREDQTLWVEVFDN